MIIAEGTPGELKASIGSGVLNVRVRDPGQRREAERMLAGILEEPIQLESDPTALSARIADVDRVARAFSELSRSGVEITDFALGQPSLDEVFLALTDRPARGDDARSETATSEEGSA